MNFHKKKFIKKFMDTNGLIVHGNVILMFSQKQKRNFFAK